MAAAEAPALVSLAAPSSPRAMQTVLSPDPPERIPLRVRDEYFINLKEWTSVQHAGAEAAGAAAGSTAASGEGGAPPPSGVVPKKSHRAMKRDRREERANALCYQYLQGVCVHKDTCRFSHDVASYLSQRLPDLPGECPWANVEAGCPHGITCRWAHAHRFPSPFEREWGFPSKAGAKDEKEKEQETKEGTEKKEEASPAAVESSPTDGQEGAEIVEEEGKKSTTEEAACPGDAPVGPASPSTPPPLLRLPPPLYKGDGSVPASTLPMRPFHPPPLPESNALDKELQASLWKGTYDFTATTRLLAALGFEDRQANIEKLQRARGERRDQRKGLKRKAGAGGEGEENKAQANPQDAMELGEKELEKVEAEGIAEKVTEGAAEKEPSAAPSAAASGEPSSVSAAPVSSSSPLAHLVTSSLPPPPTPSLSSPSPPAFPSRSLRPFDLRGKRFLAPLTTVGNLPFRRICVGYGAEVTCGEMAMATNLLKGQAQEWALLRRHPSERCFGVQICGAYPDAMARAARLVEDRTDASFVDINCGCPVNIICDRGAGSGCMLKPRKLLDIVRATASATTLPVTIKLRKGFHDDRDIAHTLVPSLAACGARAVVLHGRSRQQRYSRRADWPYIFKCALEEGNKEKGREEENEDEEDASDKGAGEKDDSLPPSDLASPGTHRRARDAPVPVPRYPPLGAKNNNTTGMRSNQENGERCQVEKKARGEQGGCTGALDDGALDDGALDDLQTSRRPHSASLSSPLASLGVSTFAACAPRVQVVGNGDIFSWRDHCAALRGSEEEEEEEEDCRGGQDGSRARASFEPLLEGTEREREAGLGLDSSVGLAGQSHPRQRFPSASPLASHGVTTTYVARGALIKPWIFTEIAERRDWDISASERLDMYRTYASNGLEHWGSDARGVETTRRFLLEWLSFAHRYVPLGILERPGSQRLDQKPPVYVGRSDLETLLSSDNPADWIAITELLLGPAPTGFQFAPKHKANAYPRRTEDAGIASANAVVTAHKR